MRRSYEEYWKNSIGKQGNGSGKLSTYRQIKIGFRKEKYLDSIKNFRERSALTKLRISAHRLEIETYRYGKKSIPRNERFCSLCIPDSLIHIGDEFHAIMVCNKLKKPRSEIFEMFRQECEQFDKMGIHEKFIYILTYEGPLLSHVAKFVHEIISVKRDVSVWHMYSKMWYSDVWKSPRGVYHNAYINQGPTMLILGVFGWELLAGGLAVVGWCFSISQSQPSFLLGASG